MAQYIILADWTEQGMRNVKESPGRSTPPGGSANSMAPRSPTS